MIDKVYTTIPSNRHYFLICMLGLLFFIFEACSSSLKVRKEIDYLSNAPYYEMNFRFPSFGHVMSMETFWSRSPGPDEPLQLRLHLKGPKSSRDILDTLFINLEGAIYSFPLREMKVEYEKVTRNEVLNDRKHISAITEIPEEVQRELLKVSGVAMVFRTPIQRLTYKFETYHLRSVKNLIQKAAEAPPHSGSR